MAKLKDPTVSPPVLPTELNQLYSLLNPEAKVLFNRVFVWLWSYLVNKRLYLRSWPVLYYYWGVDAARKDAGLNSSELAILTFAWQLSANGTKVFNSFQIYNSSFINPELIFASRQNIMNHLVKLGYLSRSCKDPARKYYSIPWPPKKVFISFTYKGVMLIKNIESKLYDIVLHSSLDEITGNNKKG